MPGLLYTQSYTGTAEAPPTDVTGLAFTGRTGNQADWLMFGWSESGGNSGLDTVTPPAMFPMTYIWRAFPRSQTHYYASLFYVQDYAQGGFNPNTYNYYGAHPINDGSNGTPPAAWEIPSSGGQDETNNVDGSVAYVDFGTFPPADTSAEGWFTQVFRARNNAGTIQLEYFWDWPNTDNASRIFVTHAAGSLPAHPILCVGDAPWARGAETYYGVLRGFQYYDTYLSTAQIQSEIDDPGSVRTPWYLKLNPTPDDIADDSGNGNDPAWVNANRPDPWEAA